MARWPVSTARRATLVSEAHSGGNYTNPGMSCDIPFSCLTISGSLPDNFYNVY